LEKAQNHAENRKSRKIKVKMKRGREEARCWVLIKMFCTEVSIFTSQRTQPSPKGNREGQRARKKAEEEQ